MSHVLNVLVEGYDAEKAKHIQLEEDQVSQDWIDIYSSRQNGTILQSTVRGVEEKVYSYAGNKKMACAVIEIGEVRGLIPLEFLGATDRNEARQYIGEKVAFMVIAIDKNNDFFVGSRTAALEEMKNITLKKIAVNDITIGVVRKVFNSALFVDIGGLEVRVPTSDVSYGWIDTLHDFYKVGDHVKVRIMEIDKQNKEVKVSIKATKPNPWDTISKHFTEQAEYVAKVSGISEFGTFVELKEGISGLAQHLRHEVLKKGDKVLVRVMKIRPEDHKINVKVVKVLS
ncbi:S1 RNA-binding domain-containing protein [Bacillus sp. 1P06AnD]|uniref:S1 RNA-binding domain-containing protein n=1 Tax=Bacillus sp. 1P06AnD TaxID=3132208 RepID=UPI0039A29B26